mmetsp:Transcript_131726/g.262850  ORF Transcript_131726/g.262850 Transcript_131726/m.262850 type:complete len:458 (+) Transcript_131726:46-1419(+)
MAIVVSSGLPAGIQGGSRHIAKSHLAYPATTAAHLQAGVPLGSLPSAVALATATLALAAGASKSQRLTPSRQEIPKLAIGSRRLSTVKVQAAPEDGAAGKAEDDPLLAEAKAAAEAAKLELEAAKLRAEVDAMQRSATEKVFQDRATRLLGDLPGLGLQELVSRIKETEGLELNEEQGQRLAKACGLGQVPEDVAEKLRRAEAFNLPDVEELRQKATSQPIFFTSATLTSETFDKELKSIVEEVRVAKQRQAEQETFEQKARESRSSDTGTATAGPAATTTPGPKQGENDDRSTGSRILASLPLLLPLSQAFQYAIPFASAFPPITVLFGPIAFVTLILNIIPFGSLLAFVIFIFLAQWKEGVPRLVRFNLEQSVLLNISLSIPTFLLAAVEFSAKGAPSDAAVIGGAVTFFAMLAVSVYCAACNIDGKEPDGLGFISATTYNVIDAVPDGDNNKRQ